MRTLLAILIFMGGAIVLGATADAARKHSTKPQHETAQQRETRGTEVECERARHEDPTGKYAAYPCWAQEVFGRGTRGGPIWR